MNYTRNLWSYDLECYKNFFSATFWNKEKEEKVVFVIYKERNDLNKLVDWIKSQDNLVLVGFNNKSYDDTFLKRILSGTKELSTLPSVDLTRKFNNLSTYIINYDKQDKKIQKVVRDLRSLTYFTSIDLLEVIREGYSTKSLKGVAINLKYHRIQDLPIPFDAEIEDHQVEDLLDYNFNDVVITDKIKEFIKDRLEMREILSEQYGVNLLSDADSSIAKTLFNKFYSEKTGLPIEEFKYKRTSRDTVLIGDIILPWISFKTPLYQDYLESLRKVVISNIKEKAIFDIPSLIVGDMEYTIGLGGIHSVDKPAIFTNESIDGVEMMLLDVDVASQYPRRIIHSEIVPEHLDAKVFVEVLSLIVDTRIIKKAEGKIDKIARIIAEGLKITVNTVYGLFNFAYYFLYDPKATYAVTVNNQLAILMLIEELNLNDIKVISANTDGIIIHTASSDLDRIRDIYHVWEATTGFTLEETNYSKYIRRDINNYITIKTDGEVKNKGIFIPQNGILKGYDKPIVGIALQEYFLHGKNPIEIVEGIGSYQYKFVNPDFPKGELRTVDIYDYCLAQKIGPQYTRVEYHTGGKVEFVQRSLRYYASNGGGTLYKVKPVIDKGSGKATNDESKATLLSSSNITLFNDYYKSDDYDINYQYYIDEVEKIIAKVEGRIWIDKEDLENKIKSLTDTYQTVLTKLIDMKEKGKDHLKSYQTYVTRLTKVENDLNQLTETYEQSSK